MNQNQVLKPTPAANHIGVSKSTLMRLKHDGSIPYVQLTEKKSIGFLVSDLNAFLTSRRVGGAV